MKNRLLQQNIEEDAIITPLWYEASEENLDEKVKETNITVSGRAIINTVKNILEFSEGNILSIINVVNNLNIEGVFNFSRTEDKKKKVKTSTDIDGVTVYVLFDYTHKVSNSKYLIKRVYGFSKKKIQINGEIFIFKPRNKTAREICNRLLDYKVKDIKKKKKRS